MPKPRSQRRETDGAEKGKEDRERNESPTLEIRKPRNLEELRDLAREFDKKRKIWLGGRPV